MTDQEFSTTEDQASYGIGLQMGEQFSAVFPGVSLAAGLAGFQDAFAGKPPQVSHDEINAAFQLMQQRLKDESSKKAEKFGADSIAFLETNAIRDDVIVTESGLQYEVITSGDGAIPDADSTVRTHYRGTLIDGTEFDSSYSRNQPTEFPVKGVIAGWTEALQLMTVGSKWKLFIPHQLAYGERGAGGSIGPYQALIFEIELLAIV
ncbi:MAG: FKBP-type peptidyl-prolyl cis-trans isomerase [Gammaproteobacteria bacterium]|nr:FKBP-type peptidyl-prolyl cis-trans isomerase [Gammaproteobacteria bacterium]MBL7000780.1 FKBP-type peptidyl-prolyl cis-trans isomerase [Gammaproteobacteria bacterium]